MAAIASTWSEKRLIGWNGIEGKAGTTYLSVELLGILNHVDVLYKLIFCFYMIEICCARSKATQWVRMHEEVLCLVTLI